MEKRNYDIKYTKTFKKEIESAFKYIVNEFFIYSRINFKNLI